MSQYLTTFYNKIKAYFCTTNVTMGSPIFYKNAKKYWSTIPATLDGVLGGYAHINNTDLEGSSAFIRDILSSENAPETDRALDCGAGIGRVTKNILIHMFNKVDLVEQDEKFAEAASDFIGKDNPKLGIIHVKGLQDFEPTEKYDVIWIQWVLGHLNDDDLCDFLQRCRNALNPRGVIFIKENITADNEIEYDEEDSSVTRPYELMRQIIEVAKLKVIKVDIQQGFPDDIYAVYMFAVIPTCFDAKQIDLNDND